MPLATEIPEGVDAVRDRLLASSRAERPADDVLAVAAGYPALSLVPPENPAG